MPETLLPLTLSLAALLLILPAPAPAQDLPAPAAEATTFNPQAACGGALLQSPEPAPQMGPPRPGGWCRFSCGLSCETSADCPDGASCDPFITCSVGHSRSQAPTAGVPREMESETDPGIEAAPADGAEVWCPLGAPSCFRDRQCDEYCGMKGFGACEQFCCACLG